MSHAFPSAYDMDLYKVLQVHPRSQIEIIEVAHKALLKIHAPRIAGATESNVKRIAEAYEIIANPKSRREYDEYRKTKSNSSGMIGPYRKIAKVAQGGFGVTYKAQHQLLDELSCVKICSEISPVAEEILKQEAKSIWNLSHYGLPIMRDVIELDNGALALVMSWVEGPTLEQAVEKHGKRDPEIVASIADRVLNTLGWLHRHGILHGDLKPQNIILQPEKHIAQLVDFGLSSVKPTADTGSKGYTEIFSPPEQIEGKTLVPESDLYSLGMCMIYALTGKIDAVRLKQVPSNVPDAMCEFIKSLVVYNVLNRPRDAAELSAKFDKVREKSFGRARSNWKDWLS